KTMKKDGYKAGDVIGQAGVEAAYDKYLQGTPGVEELQFNSLGEVIGTPKPKTSPTAGNNIPLTIHISLPPAAGRPPQYGLKLARAEGRWAANGGAIVAMDPRNGDVLAMASYPTYKPSVYVGRIDPKKLAPLIDPKAAEKANFPAINRATQGVYPAGSTFK